MISILTQNINLFYKLATKTTDHSLEVLKANIGKYVHFSDSERLGINFTRSPGPGINPAGIYGFPLTTKLYQQLSGQGSPPEFYGYLSYIYLFEPTGNILNLDTANSKELHKMIMNFLATKLDQENLKTINIMFRPYGQESFWKYLSLLIERLIAIGSFKNKHVASNVILRNIGYDGIITRQEAMHDDIPSQIVILEPSKMTVIDKLLNPITEKFVEDSEKEFKSSSKEIFSLTKLLNVLVDYLEKGLHSTNKHKISIYLKQLLDILRSKFSLSSEEDFELYLLIQSLISKNQIQFVKDIFLAAGPEIVDDLFEKHNFITEILQKDKSLWNWIEDHYIVHSQ